MELVDKKIPSYILQLKKEGNKIFFISHREKETKRETERWLKNKKIVYDDLFLVNEKRDTLKSLNLDIYVDDDPKELFYKNKSPVAKNIFLFDWPYNSNIKNIKRVFSWGDLYNKILKIKN